ncbi:hypothetical protein H0W91_02795 [Patescibacteria group bacterium]|nr:hypothetical protein [Patescibacteria group bacterium]
MAVISGLLFDLWYIFKGKYIKTGKEKKYKFAFIVHSRNYLDIYRKFPLARKLPKDIVLFFMKHLWPITLSKVTGVISSETKKEVPGFVLGITMPADLMLLDRPYALKKIRQALYLAKGQGVTIIGLGGLTSSLSKGGLDLLDIPINITTGHAYTAYNIVQNLLKLTNIFEVPKESISVTVVGAAGSIGSMSSMLIARESYHSLTLIDTKRKQDKVKELSEEIKKINSKIVIKISDKISDILDCDFVITATNTAEALVTPDHVSDGMVIIDDAQPSDIHPDVLKMENVLVIEAGVVHTPNINSNFNYGLKSRTDNFCCMAELLVLASYGWNEHYVINKATLENIDHISEMGKALDFRVASFQNFQESITNDKIEKVKKVFCNKHGISF